MTYADQHLSAEQCNEAADALHVLSGMLLFEFARHSETAATRELIVRNFIARADTMVRGLLRLWEIKDYGDCWIIHRALLDRLFHLRALNDNDQFDLFDDWSFKMQHEAANRLMMGRKIFSTSPAWNRGRASPSRGWCSRTHFWRHH